MYLSQIKMGEYRMKTNFKAETTLSMLLMILLVTGTIFALETILVPKTSATYDPVVIYKEMTQISSGHEEEAPCIALDRNGNLQIVWIGNYSSNLYYMMVDRYGNTLINETCLDPSPNATAKHARRTSIAIDSVNNVHIVFHSEYIYEPWP